MQTIRINDEGTTIRGTIYDEDDTIMDISTATTKEFIFRKPDGTSITRTASFFTSGSDGIIIYTLINGDIDQAGRWEIEAYVVLPGGRWASTNGEFYVNTRASS